MTAPRPPADLHLRAPQVVTLPAGQSLHRFHSAQHDPVHFDTSTLGRLNAPGGSYGVLYVAQEQDGAFAETFLRTPGLNLIDADRLRAKAYARLAPTRDLRLVRLTGPGLAILGATAEVTHGGLPYDVPQAWSQAIHSHPIQPDGIAYTARHDDEQTCYALFDRCHGAISKEEGTADLDQDWFWTLADKYQVGLAP